MVGLVKVCNLCNLQKYMQLHFLKVINIITKQNINKNNKNMPINNNHGLGKIKSETQTSL